MIPYFISLILMAIPVMWLEWAQGRYGGMRGHGTTPGIFQSIWQSRIAKYLGVLGIFIPTVILIYYTYIGSWTLGYGIYSLLDLLPKVELSALHQDMGPQEISKIILQPFDEFRNTYTGIAKVIVIMWIFGGKRIWDEMHWGAQFRAPFFFYYTAKYITPLFLGAILLAWTYQNIALPFFKGTFFQKALEGVDMGWAVWVTRIFLMVLFLGMCIIVRSVMKHQKKEVSI